jgi:hypothetical protein
MAAIFLSYRRTDSPQACRVFDWLVRRFGRDAVFMDVAAIPLAVSFADSIREAITGSSIMIVLIGSGWLPRIREADDPVRLEIEAALENRVPILPVLIGNTVMPDPDDLPASMAALAFQNAVTVGVSHDFDTHMQALLPTVETMLGKLARQSIVTADPDVIHRACGAVIACLKDSYALDAPRGWTVEWQVVGTRDFVKTNQVFVTLFLHRVVRLGAFLELHFILSFWGISAVNEHLLAGWVIRQLERTPVIPGKFFDPGPEDGACELKIRRSDEDPRQVWQMITDEPLCLSLAYVATVSPQPNHPEA